VQPDSAATEQATAVAYPSVTAIVATRDRIQLLREAVASILAQDYPGELDVIVILDQWGDGERPTFDDPQIRLLDNGRTPGLAGGRNTGILAAGGELVAFCDDDDAWHAGKLTAQVDALLAQPGAEFASCSIDVKFGDTLSARNAGSSLVSHGQLLESRMAMLHSSTFVIRREALIEGIGLVDEHVPGSQNEDWDLLLRASARQPIVNVDRPLVTVLWTERSYFNRAWDTRNASLEWMLASHPDIATSAVGVARVYGQIGFGCVAMGDRRTAVRWTRRSIRANWREPRAYLTLAAVVGVSPEWILRVLHRRGRGV
jgi:glycosyltransferase involved in cell wall biosynthesis